MTLFAVFLSISLAISFQTIAQDTAVDDAVNRVLENDEIQSEFPRFEAPEEIKPPGWLESIFDAIGSFLSFLAPVLEILFYVAIVAFVVWLIYFLVDKFEWRRGNPEEDNAKKVRITVAPARASKPEVIDVPDLSDADKMAENGHYAEAVHILLIAAIDFIQRKIKGILSVSETSREILNNDNVAAEDKGEIGYLVEQVERALFAGKTVDREEYEFCRNKFLNLVGEVAQ